MKKSANTTLNRILRAPITFIVLGLLLVMGAALLWLHPNIAGIQSANAGYNITASLRFASTSTPYLIRTFASPTNNKIWTWSAWVKRSDFLRYNRLFTSGTNGDEAIRFDNAADAIQIFFNAAASGNIVTSALFRDPAAWIHIVVGVDTTQATAANRVRIYVNGSEITNDCPSLGLSFVALNAGSSRI